MTRYIIGQGAHLPLASQRAFPHVRQWPKWRPLTFMEAQRGQKGYIDPAVAVMREAGGGRRNPHRCPRGYNKPLEGATGADDERTCVRRPISSSSHLVAQKLLLSPLLPAHGAASEGTTLFFGGPAEPSKKRVKHPKTPKRQSRAEGSSEGKPPQEGRPPALLGKIPKAGLHLANAPGRGVTSGVKAFPTWKRGETPGGRWRQRWTLPEDRNPSPGAT
ncbi:uncharacterized protein LOC128351874 isoform X2 [Hemicordylus capensis]|uniref:uncharacterized protein LOC128351874 isoform X2 n=1 Tax=Hemicordylus capensis TaxID=884348 RepID=UPI00230228E0|nr:uncharacterized protein LOC128351874 isoform X2 [Hemicordylus capensis]